MVCPSSWSKINLLTPSPNQITLLFLTVFKVFQEFTLLLPCFIYITNITVLLRSIVKVKKLNKALLVHYRVFFSLVIFSKSINLRLI